MVPGSRIGHIGAPLEVHGQTVGFGAATDRLRSGSLSFADARTLGALKLDTADEGVPTIKNMVLAMDGVTADGTTLHTIQESINESGQLQRNVTLVRFTKLGLVAQLMHTVASPPVAYLLFAIGMALLLFEFFTAGVGVAGLVGAGCTLLGCYGLAALPARGWAIALLVISMLAFAIDVQVGIPRFWTGVGVVTFTVGTWYLYRPLPGSSLRLGWITLLAGIVAMLLTFIVGMPSMVRTRFATPTIGREWMLGEMGTAVDDIDPVGIALVGSARWRARTNRATPLRANDRLRVVGIDGVTLEVEPETGGARDYREGRGRKGKQSEAAE
jgi:membrane-bound serine protease (ClpP class)